MIDLNTNIFVITLSIDELSAPGKRQSLILKRETISSLYKTYLNTENSQVQKNEKIRTNSNQKSYSKVRVKVKSIATDKEGFFKMIKGLIPSGRPNNFKFIKQKFDNTIQRSREIGNPPGIC